MVYPKNYGSGVIRGKLIFSSLTILFIFLIIGNALTQEKQIQYEKIYRKFLEKNHHIAFGDPLHLTGRELLDTRRELIEYLIEFRVEEGFQFHFLTKKDSAQITLTLFKAPSQIFAFGLYAAEKTPSLKFFDIGYQSYLNSQELFSWYDRYVIITTLADTVESPEKYLKEAAEQFIKLLPKQKKKTPILDALPGKNRVEHSEKFYAHRWLNQDYFRNIYYADYRTSEGYSRIFIIDNGSTASADSNFWRYYSFIKNKTKVLEEDLKIATDYFVVEEPLWGKTILAKKNQIIYGILDYKDKKWTEDRLDELLNRLKKKKVVKSG